MSGFGRARAEGWALGVFGGDFTCQSATTHASIKFRCETMYRIHTSEGQASDSETSTYDRATIRRSQSLTSFRCAHEGTSALGLARTVVPTSSLALQMQEARSGLEGTEGGRLAHGSGLTVFDDLLKVPMWQSHPNDDDDDRVDHRTPLITPV
ncbi:hypothetical protein IW262DRAFT_1298287 [Armillaria fumosa]|nr:hypothetical protein IW262DRAFT_1298287 [Armillaria fumosa]